MNRWETILRPILSEKASSQQNPVVVEVNLLANKHQIKTAIQEIYGVTVESVRTMIVPGKLKRRGQTIGRRPKWKKAFVALKSGETIDFSAAE